jgi:hypothetical protein
MEECSFPLHDLWSYKLPKEIMVPPDHDLALCGLYAQPRDEGASEPDGLGTGALASGVDVPAKRLTDNRIVRAHIPGDDEHIARRDREPELTV